MIVNEIATATEAYSVRAQWNGWSDKAVKVSAVQGEDVGREGRGASRFVFGPESAPKITSTDSC